MPTLWVSRLTNIESKQYLQPSPYLGMTRREKYAARLQRMTETSQQTIRDVFGLTRPHHPAPDESKIHHGHHLRKASLHQENEPDIDFWMEFNRNMRVARNRARKAGKAGIVEKLSDRLDDFHVALEAFVKGISMDEAAVDYFARKAERDEARMHAKEEEALRDYPPAEKTTRKQPSSEG